MLFFPRSSRKNGVRPLFSPIRPLRRLRVPTSARVGAASFLAGVVGLIAFFVPVAALFADDAPVAFSPSFPVPSASAYFSNDFFTPTSPTSPTSQFSAFSSPRRPSFFYDLAGIPAVRPSAVEPSAPLASSFFADVSQPADFTQITFSPQTADLSQLEESFYSPSFAENASISPIVRGAYLSNLPIVPFRGRFFAYANASWGSQGEQNASPRAAGFDVAAFGGGVGQDWRLTKNAIWGYGLQGRNIQIDPDADIYEAEIDSLAGFLHMSLFGPLWRLDLSIGAAKSWNAQSASVFDVLKYSSTQWNYEAEFGVRFDKGYTRVEPLVNVRVMTLQEPSDAERRLEPLGRPSDYSNASYRLKLGSRFSWEYATHLATLKPFLTATWNHEFGDRALYVSGENTPFPTLYRYAKHRMARDRLELGGGVDSALRDTVDVFFRYDVEFAKEYANYLFYAGFHKKF